MKLRIILLWALFTGVCVANVNNATHTHPLNNVGSVGSCNIEIINHSLLYATVYGTFDDGTPLIPFGIMPDDSSHYIDLFYNGYCHLNMYLDIINANGFHIYTKYTPYNTLIKLMPSYK
jgi:hypothetical protein